MITIKETNYYTTKEIAEKFGFHIRTIQGWVKKGKLIPYKFSIKKFYYDENAIEDCIKGK